MPSSPLTAGASVPARSGWTGRTPPVGTGPGLGDRVPGGRPGRIAGNMPGRPVARGDHWRRDRIDHSLRPTGALLLTDSLPGVEDVEGGTDGCELRPEWRQFVRGRVHGSHRDDDADGVRISEPAERTVRLGHPHV